MSHHNGHTVIEMNNRTRRGSRSRSRSRSPRPDHEHPSVHSSGLDIRTPVRGLSPNSNRSPNRYNHGHNMGNSNNHSNTSLHHESETHKPDENTSLLRSRRDLHKNEGRSEHTQPLLETDANHPNVPLAGPEIDDLDDETSTASPHDHTGIDDGFFPDSASHGDPRIEGRFGEDDKGLDKPGIENGSPGNKHDDGSNDESGDEADGVYVTRNGNYLTASQPMLHGSHTNLSGITTRFDPTSPFPYAPDFPGGGNVEVRITPDVNVYQQKKNLAQGMMDLALLSANANQLRYVLEAGDLHPYYYPSLIFISASLVIQVAVGVGLIINSRYNVKNEEDICKADRINDFTVIGIFLITVVNVFIASFGVATSPNTTIVRNGTS